MFVLISCEDSDTIVVVEDNNIMAVVTVLHNPYLHKLEFYGNLITKEICDLNYVVLNSDTVHYDETSPYYSNDYDGNIYFSLNSNEYSIPFNKSVEIGIHTGTGIVRGNGTVPDSVTNISFNLDDTVKVGDNLLMLFNGDADYYLIRYQYRYLNSDSTGIESEYGDIYTTENEANFNSTLLDKDGLLTILYISAINGPLPEVNSIPNMYGEGKGFLSLWWYQYSGEEFAIGNGI